MSSDALWLQQASYAAAALGAIGYGFHIAVFYKCITAILHNAGGTERTRWIAFSGGLLTLGTVNVACSLHFNQLAFIDRSDYPNGPAAFISEQQSNSANVGAVATSIMMVIASNMFMIYHVHNLWKRLAITGILSLILLGSLVMSAFHAVQLTSTQDTNFPNSPSDIRFDVPYVSLATALNILITAILIPRLLELRRQVSSTNADAKVKFTSAEALIIESAFPSGLISLVFILLYGLQKISAILLLPLMVQVMAIMPTLIIYRTVQGHGLSSDSVRRLLVATPGSRYRTSMAVEPGVDLDSLDRRGDSSIAKVTILRSEPV